MQGLAAIAETNGSFTDLLDGNILGFASYDSALSASEVQTHSNAFFAVPEPSTVLFFGLAVASLFGREQLLRRRSALA